MYTRSGVIYRMFMTLLAWFASGYVLYRFEYIIAFGEIDNIVGMIPIALVITFAAGMTSITWMKHIKKQISIFSVIALLVVLSVVLFPNAIRGNWWINTTTSDEAQAAPDLTLYTPFSEGSLTAKLDEESELYLKDDQPILDGATALYPVYAAFAEAVFDEQSFIQDNVRCTNTRGAYEAIVSGACDIIFVAGASEQQIAAANNAGATLHFTPIGREAFVFITGKENPIKDITYQQIRNIYSGKTAYWNTLGWSEGGRIIAFQRPEGSGSQTGLQNIMGDIPIQVPQPLPDKTLIGTNSLMKQISVTWQGVQPALGYSYRYYATTMYANPETKLLSVNGVSPSFDNIQNGSYPFAADFYAVTNGEPNGNAKLLIDWILTQGQEIIEKTGYAPIATK